MSSQLRTPVMFLKIECKEFRQAGKNMGFLNPKTPKRYHSPYNFAYATVLNYFYKYKICCMKRHNKAITKDKNQCGIQGHVTRFVWLQKQWKWLPLELDYVGEATCWSSEWVNKLLLVFTLNSQLWKCEDHNKRFKHKHKITVYIRMGEI